MKLSDLLIDYCEIEGYRICSMLNGSIYFAVRSNAERIEAYHLSHEDLLPLLTNPSSIHAFFASDKINWIPMEEWEYSCFQKGYRLMALVGMMQIYRNSDCLSRIDAAAVRWFQDHAESGEPTVKYCLGKLYRGGCGVEWKPNLAKYWISRAMSESGVSEKELHDGLAKSPDEDRWDMDERATRGLLLYLIKESIWMKIVAAVLCLTFLCAYNQAAGTCAALATALCASLYMIITGEKYHRDITRAYNPLQGKHTGGGKFAVYDANKEKYVAKKYFPRSLLAQTSAEVSFVLTIREESQDAATIELFDCEKGETVAIRHVKNKKAQNMEGDFVSLAADYLSGQMDSRPRTGIGVRSTALPDGDLSAALPAQAEE